MILKAGKSKIKALAMAGEGRCGGNSLTGSQGVPLLGDVALLE